MVWLKIDHISHQIEVVVISGALNRKVLYMVVNPHLILPEYYVRGIRNVILESSI